MPSFKEAFEKTGLDPNPTSPFMVVPLGGSNIVRLADAAGVKLEYDTDRLKVVQVTRKQEHLILDALRPQFTEWGLENKYTQDLTRSFANAASLPENVSGDNQLYLVTGNVRGLTNLDAVRKPVKQHLDVAVVPALSHTLAFKFVQHLDEASGNLLIPRWSPDNAEMLTARLNWVYGPQANIKFVLKGASVEKVEQRFHREPHWKADLLDKLAPLKNTSVHLTVFVLPDPQFESEGGKRASGLHPNPPHPEDVVCVVHKPTRPSDDDPFFTSLAHEVGHFLISQQGDHTGGHHSRDHVLLNDQGMQSTRLDSGLVRKMNPP